MITTKYGRPITASYLNDLNEFYGLSTDVKPTGVLMPSGFSIPNGAVFVEMDTGKVYVFDAENAQWREL